LSDRTTHTGREEDAVQPTRQHQEAHKRIASIDTLRVVAILAVISIHTNPFQDINELTYWLIDQGARFAVPFFFVASGYFFFRKSTTSEPGAKRLLRYQARLWLLFIAWNLIYLLKPNFSAFTGETLIGAYANSVVATWHAMPDTMLDLTLRGIYGHLWFLPALAIGLLIVGTLDLLGQRAWIAPVATSLYLLGLMAGSYSALIGDEILAMPARQGPFFSTAFVALGYMFAMKRSIESLGSPTIWIAAGFSLHFSEVFLLYQHFGVPPHSHDYLVGTIAIGLGVMLLALTRPDLGKGKVLPSLGPLTLGVYAGHYLIIESPFNWALEAYFHPVLWQVAFPLIVFLIAISLSLAVSRIRWTAWLVR
jgi:surface polysaccharide O-acyltransferase-like enzyme